MVSVMLYPVIFGETIRNMFGCGFILLCNAMEVFSVGGC